MALLRIDRRANVQVLAVVSRAGLNEVGWGDEALKIVVKRSNRSVTGAREIIFQARVVIVGLQVFQERISAGCRARVVLARGRGAERHRRSQIEELRPSAGLGRRQSQLQL